MLTFRWLFVGLCRAWSWPNSLLDARVIVDWLAEPITPHLFAATEGMALGSGTARSFSHEGTEKNGKRRLNMQNAMQLGSQI